MSSFRSEQRTYGLTLLSAAHNRLGVNSPAQSLTVNDVENIIKFIEPPSSSVVIDIGSGFTKAGFGGNELPERVFPSVVSKNLQELPCSLFHSLF